MSTYRSPVPGLLLGLVLPLAAALLIKILLVPDVSFTQYPRLLINDARIGAKVLSLAVLPNMLAMMYFNRRRKSHMVRGLMLINVVWIVIFVLQRFVWS